MRNTLLAIVLFFCLIASSYSAPAYGTKMPAKKEFFIGLQSHNISERHLEDGYGEVKSFQNFLLVSYGLFDWLSVDLKGGEGYIKHREVGSSEIYYHPGFAGGYGLRLRLYEKQNFKAVLGFQHISVHPKKVNLANGVNRAILDDWQFSLLASYDFGKFTPYLGSRWSRVDYIHKVNEDRKRRMSDLTKSTGLIFGVDIPFGERLWLNLEGQYFDSTSFALSLNFKF
jgi:hypothetical protein